MPHLSIERLTCQTSGHKRVQHFPLPPSCGRIGSPKIATAQFIRTEATIRVSLVSILVEDQDKALAFYTDILGFEKMADIPMGEFRWLTVTSSDGVEGVEVELSHMPRSRLLAPWAFVPYAKGPGARSRDPFTQRASRAIPSAAASSAYDRPKNVMLPACAIGL